MASRKIIIKADDYRYPSFEERREVIKDYPQLSHFDFKYKSELESLINDKLSLDEAHLHSNLYWWDNCLLNRLASLKETYIYAFANYKRGFNDEHSKCSESEFINRLQFDYFAEIFYYFFFSSRDILAQIIRLYYKIDIKEHKLHFDSHLIEKIKDENVKKLANTFYTETKDASDFRNGFAHRFTPTLCDNRSVLIEKEGRKSLGFGNGTIIESKKIVININDSMNSLAIFLLALKKYMRN